jgi:glycosyltransferase involved in cell wall biosynthesis
MKRLSVVIPALNEEKGIGPVLKEIPIKSLKGMGYETEVIVIDNGSKDKTPYIARQHGATVIIQPIRGYGNAYKTGFANASGDLIATGDADRTYPFEELPKFIEKMENEDLDFITTNRVVHVNHEVMTPSHIFGNRVLTIMTKYLFNWPFVDSQSGMWVFRREIWGMLDVRSSGMPFSQEIKFEAYRRGFKCAEVPIKYRARIGETKLKAFRDGAEVILQIFQKKFTTGLSILIEKRSRKGSVLEGEVVLHELLNEDLYENISFNDTKQMVEALASCLETSDLTV